MRLVFFASVFPTPLRQTDCFLPRECADGCSSMMTRFLLLPAKRVTPRNPITELSHGFDERFSSAIRRAFFLSTSRSRPASFSSTYISPTASRRSLFFAARPAFSTRLKQRIALAELHGASSRTTRPPRPAETLRNGSSFVFECCREYLSPDL